MCSTENYFVIPKNPMHRELAEIIENHAVVPHARVFVTDGHNIGSISCVLKSEMYEKNTEIHIASGEVDLGKEAKILTSSTADLLVKDLKRIGLTHEQNQIKFVSAHAEWVAEGIEVRGDDLYIHIQMETYTF